MSELASFSTRRIAAGFTIEGIAEEFRVSLDVVRGWEQGETQPPQHISKSVDLIASLATESTPDAKGDRADLNKNLCTNYPMPKAKPSSTPAAMMKAPDAPSASLIKSRQRVADHGEVFTPPWLVERMLDHVKGETERIDSRFLEPACGSGNFLVPILQRKLAAVEVKYARSDFEKRHYALVALTCCYGIELLADNIAECRANMLEVFATYLKLAEHDDLYRSAAHVLSLNLIHGDAMTMRANDGEPISVVEWGYLGKGKFQRRDFRLDVLTGMAGFREEATLFQHVGRHEIFKPIGTQPPMTVRELAAQEPEPAR
jgi:hypothetical protein